MNKKELFLNNCYTFYKSIIREKIPDLKEDEIKLWILNVICERGTAIV